MVRFDLRRNEKKATVKRTRCAASSGLVRSRSDLKLRRRMGVMELLMCCQTKKPMESLFG